MAICIQRATVEFDEQFRLESIDWCLSEGRHWVLVGPNGAGKSAVAAVLHGAGDFISGSLNGAPQRVGVVSFEAQQALIEAERKVDDADILDVIAKGTAAGELLARGCKSPQLRERLATKLGIADKLDRSFRKLSTGETRKILIIRALCCDPELLVLDEPFEGLDAASSEVLQQELATISASVPMVLVLNRFDDCPGFVTHLAYMEKGRMLQQVPISETDSIAEIKKLLHLKTADITLPASDSGLSLPALDPAMPLVRMRALKIAYGDDLVFAGLDWTILPGEHWQVTGPNGSGKTCLLNLITGDHPQCYVNDIYVFGMQRGSGESIWQIKQFIGYVSSALQWEYRVSASVRQVILSGFFDSIGVYQKSSDTQNSVAEQWLRLLGMEARANVSFAQLSFGDRRLVLIARAMVKAPPLLILDEPCLGLDDLNRQLVLALIEKICTGNKTTVLYVNHHKADRIAGITQHLALKGR